MAGKGAPPLFDLIRDSGKAPEPARRPQAPPPSQPSQPHSSPASNGSAAPAHETRAPEPARARPADPIPAPEPKPERNRRTKDPAAEGAGEARIERPAPQGPRIDPKKTLSVPVSLVLVVGVVVILGALIAFSAGFSLGEKNRDDQLRPFLQTPADDVVDPLVGLPETAQPAGTTGSGASPAARPDAPAPSQAQRRGPASSVTQDTRQASHNYLLIASRLDGERALKAAMFLSERGLPALAFDPSKGASKNRWQLYSLLGFHSDTFREQWKARADHKVRIEAVCAQMTPEDGGPIDASTAYWERYAP